MHLQLNLGTGSGGAFSILANTAFNMTLDPPFNPYANDVFFVHGAYLLEDVGVTAYTARISQGCTLRISCRGPRWIRHAAAGFLHELNARQ
jgi:hypothetical protein